ncbi:hypothetical protein T440DRAFT_481005 [Plenodomus tracheiphilus IPT5]|uniref:Uncharacterized protein n=1 Tax=Plenodomus tracheiphilus IPT5 TaxID=1408161 RepID=A0A6A7B257_9PLEO|nr:hypothetical protein T440DRAFT_481005 [Plenodomus tracheiphilus IPT5]
MADHSSKWRTKQEESAQERDQAGDADESLPPPVYSSLPEAVAADMLSLRIGDPKDTISVPMIHSTMLQRKRDLLLPFGKRGAVTQTVIVRKMTREHYLKRYAKDAEGNYIGSDRPAEDAGLVFVPGKSSDQELLEQVRKVAFGKEHCNKYFMTLVLRGDTID